jgi:hypothetical protein
MTEDMFRKTFYSHLTDTEYEQLKNEAAEAAKQKEERKNKSKFLCRIPDWTGQGGMVEFWINDDNSFETIDSRINDSDIRDGLKALINW